MSEFVQITGQTVRKPEILGQPVVYGAKSFYTINANHIICIMELGGDPSDDMDYALLQLAGDIPLIALNKENYTSLLKQVLD
jgi:hypothetical protein